MEIYRGFVYILCKELTFGGRDRGIIKFRWISIDKVKCSL